MPETISELYCKNIIYSDKAEPLRCLCDQITTQVSLSPNLFIYVYCITTFTLVTCIRYGVFSQCLNGFQDETEEISVKTMSIEHHDARVGTSVL